MHSFLQDVISVRVMTSFVTWVSADVMVTILWTRKQEYVF